METSRHYLIQKVGQFGGKIGDIVGMEYLLDRKGERRLAAYFHRIGEVLRTAPQRASFATYALGLMGDGERKSMEPISLLLDHVPGREGQAVADPYYGGEAAFEVTWTDVTLGAQGLARLLAELE